MRCGAAFSPALPRFAGTPPTMDCFRLLNDMGEIVPGAEGGVPDIDDETALAMQV